MGAKLWERLLVPGEPGQFRDPGPVPQLLQMHLTRQGIVPCAARVALDPLANTEILQQISEFAEDSPEVGFESTAQYQQTP